MKGHEVRLSRPQFEIMTHPARHKVVVAGRRFGKTVLGGRTIVRGGVYKRMNDDALARHQNCAFVFPTLVQGRQVAWPALKAMARPWTVKVNETESNIWLMNGSLLALRGANRPDSLRGMGWDEVVLDEYADMDPATWYEVLRPALADRNGCGTFIGTPKGWNHFKTLFDRALEEMEESESRGDVPEWAAFQYTTEEGGWVPKEEIEALKAELGEREYRQEMLASFEQLSGRVYYNFDRVESVDASLEDLGGPLEVGMDFNVDPMTAVIIQRQGHRLAVLDNIVLPNSNTEAMGRELLRRYTMSVTVPRGAPGRMLVPMKVRSLREVTIHPDPTGGARKTSAKLGETDLAILRSMGFSVNSQPVGIADRINEVNAALKSQDGDRRLVVHPRAAQVIRSLDGQTYTPGTNEPDKSGGLDHAADALGYAVHNLAPIRSSVLERRAVRL